MMTDDRVDRALLDEAIRIGALNSDRLIAVTADVARLRQALWTAVQLLRRGNADSARRCLEAELARGTPP
jgi:hypothetical protein